MNGPPPGLEPPVLSAPSNAPTVSNATTTNAPPTATNAPPTAVPGTWPHHEGACGTQIRGFDWTSTPLGHSDHWPRALRDVVSSMLREPQPMFLWWGPELLQIHNDAYVPRFGADRHPATMGQRAELRWQEMWPTIKPMIDDVMSRGRSSSVEDQLLPLSLDGGHGADAYWSYGYSPLMLDDDTVGGVLVACHETTSRVLAHRRLGSLRNLTENSSVSGSLPRLVAAIVNSVTADLDVAAVAVLQAAAIPPGSTSSASHPAMTLQLFAAVGLDAAGPFLGGASAALASWFDNPGGAAVGGVAGVAGEGAAGDGADAVGGARDLAGGRLPRHATSLLLSGDELKRFLPGFGAAAGVEAACVVPLVGARGRRTGVAVFGVNGRQPLDLLLVDHFVSLAQQIERSQTEINFSDACRMAVDDRSKLLARLPLATAVLSGVDHVYELANPLFCRALGKTLPELLGKTHAEVFAGDASPLLALLDVVHRTGEPRVARALQLPHIESDGSTGESGAGESGAGESGAGESGAGTWYDVTIDPLRDVDVDVDVDDAPVGGALPPRSPVSGILITATDVTAAVLAQGALELAAVEREMLLRAAEAASNTKDEFLAMLGHELRNPLYPILTALHLMKSRDIKGVAAEHAIIERQARHMVRLVEDLLDVSRIAHGKIELRRGPVDIGDVIARAIETASNLLASKGHHLDVRVDGGLVVDGDSDRLIQVVSNLLNNAAKFTDAGGHLGIEARRVTQKAGGAGEASEDVVVTVTDNGRGIAAAMLPLVFELFTQEQQNISRSKGGLGLGLAIVRSLAHLHGGRVEARSPGIGAGSTFIVTLPASQRPLHTVFVPPVVLVGAGPSVLIVDDNEDAADLLSLALTAAGCRTRVAYDANQAFAAVEGFTPDVALLDIGLPEIDGYELGARLRARPGLEDLRIIVVSGFGQAGDHERTRLAGFETHLVKPVKVEVLIELVRRPPLVH